MEFIIIMRKNIFWFLMIVCFCSVRMTEMQATVPGSMLRIVTPLRGYMSAAMEGVRKFLPHVQPVLSSISQHKVRAVLFLAAVCGAGFLAVNKRSGIVSRFRSLLTGYDPYPPIHGWYAFKDTVWFDRATEPAFAFTNFYESPIDIANFYTNKVESWPAVENYFQAMKTDDSAIQGRLRTLSPAQALDDKPMARDWWGNVRFQVMRKALDAKFAPGTQLASKLLSTEGRVLVEKTYGRRDKEVAWGADDGFGQNHLGRMLMVVRDSLKDKVVHPYDPVSSYALDRIRQVIGRKEPLSSAR